MTSPPDRSSRVGLWIDHAGATIVTLTARDEPRVEHVESEAESHTRLAGGSRSATPYGPQEVASETRTLRRRTQQLERYYLRVAALVAGAGRLLILGPGEARLEFERTLHRLGRKPGPRTTVHPSDKMTEPQLVARVREFYGRPAPRL